MRLLTAILTIVLAVMIAGCSRTEEVKMPQGSAPATGSATPAPIEGLRDRRASGDDMLPTLPMIWTIGDLRWQPLTNGQPLPANAVPGGSDPKQNAILYVCRASYGNGVHPGKYLSGQCNIGYGGQEINLDSYEVLTGTTFQWVNRQCGSILHTCTHVDLGDALDDIVIGGYENGAVRYVCAMQYAFGVHPGKMMPVGSNYGDWECHIGYAGEEHQTTGFWDNPVLYGQMALARVDVKVLRSPPAELFVSMTNEKDGSQHAELIPANYPADKLPLKIIGFAFAVGLQAKSLLDGTVSIDGPAAVMGGTEGVLNVSCYDSSSQPMKCNWGGK